MVQNEKHTDKEVLFALLVAKYSPENIDFQIAQTKFRMAKDDVKDVMVQLDEFRELMGDSAKKKQSGTLHTL